MSRRASSSSKTKIINVKYDNTKTLLKFKFLTFISFEVYTEDSSLAREVIAFKRLILLMLGLPIFAGLLLNFFFSDTKVSVNSSICEKENLDKELQKLVEEEEKCSSMKKAKE